jgi:type III secretion protein C
MKQTLIKLLLIISMLIQVASGDNILENKSTSRRGEFVYYYHGETLRQALTILSKSNGLRTSFSGPLDVFNKTIIGRFTVADNTALLNNLADKYGFNWFIYNSTLYLTSSPIVNRSVSVASEEFKTISANLQQIGLLSPRFSYSEVPSENRIIVSGPPIYVDLVARQINSLKITPDKQQYVVYRLKYANAVDTQLTFNNQNVTIPGIVTILQNLANGKVGTGGVVSTVNEMTKNGAKESGTSTTTAGNDGKASSNAPDNSSIQADPRTNSVILIGDTTYVNLYKNLIDRLDTPTLLVQVDVMIIHLNQDKLDQYGINWSAVLGGKTNVSYAGFANNNRNFGGLSNLTANSANMGKVNTGDVFITNLNQFDLDIRALAQNNLASVVSKPSLVTENNLPAILNISENLMTPLQYGMGNYGNLTNGLQITPYVIFNDNAKASIRLSIVLNDGSVAQDDISAAVLTQSTLTSQAIAQEGQSILLAGYSRETKVKEVSQVPGLGDIPLLGWFFKSSTTRDRNITTLYLITPKVLRLPELPSLEKKTLNLNGQKFNSGSASSNLIIQPLTPQK